MNFTKIIFLYHLNASNDLHMKMCVEIEILYVLKTQALMTWIQETG